MATAEQRVFHLNRRIDRMPDFNTAPSASGQIVADLPLGFAYEELFVELQDASGPRTESEITATDLDNLRIKIDGVTYFEMSALEIVTLLVSYYGDNIGRVMDDLGFLPIPLVPFYLRDTELAGALAWGTSDISTLTLEIDCASGCAATKAYLWAVRSRNRACGRIRSVRRFGSIPQAATGEVADYNTIPLIPGADMVAVHTYLTGSGGSGAASQQEIRANGAALIKAPPNCYNHVLREAGRAPQSGWSHFDFTAPRNLLQDVIPFSGDLSRGLGKIGELALIHIWTAAPTNTKVLLELLETVPSSR